MKQILLLVFFFNTVLAIPCTTFFLEGGQNKILGKSHDWDLSHGYAITNQRHVEKTSLNLFAEEKPTTWISKYSSVTINQYGREFPYAGLNEKGLAVEIMWLSESEHEPVDERSSINELQWIQYQLDNFASVKEVTLYLDKIRVRKGYADIHYMVCDKQGDCATIEYVKGKTVVHFGDDLPYKALANSTYADSVTYLRKHEGFGGTLPLNEKSMFSLDRFARVGALSQNKTASPENVFEILDTVRQGAYTVWNVAYDLMNSTIYFRPSKNPRVRYFSTRFSGSCTEEVKMLDLEANLAGNVTGKFEPYSADKNALMIRRSLEENPLGKVLIPLITDYPSKTKCRDVSLSPRVLY